MVRVADGMVAAAAEAGGDHDEAAKIAARLADQLLKLGPKEKVNIAVIRLANRGQSQAGDKAASEISDKLAGALHASQRWKLVERIDLQAILEEKDLIRAESDTQAILADPRLQKRLAGADYLILGGVSSGR
jgi:curli biogenesis system outer membrane secretion channel CsgG